jgi:hypothetical protein
LDSTESEGSNFPDKLLETTQEVSCFNIMGKSRALGALVTVSVGVFPAKLSFQRELLAGKIEPLSDMSTALACADGVSM